MAYFQENFELETNSQKMQAKNMLQCNVEHMFSLSNALSHDYTIDSAKFSQVLPMYIQAGVWGVIERHDVYPSILRVCLFMSFNTV